MSAYENQFIRKLHSNDYYLGKFINFVSDDTVLSPHDGDVFIVSNGINGFLGKNKNIAIYDSYGGKYVFIQPLEGTQGFCDGDKKEYIFKNGEWKEKQESVQSDWNQIDTTADDYIKNKPAIPTKTSELENDSNFVIDASYTHTDENYTTAEKTKLANIDETKIHNQNSDTILASGTIDEVSAHEVRTHIDNVDVHVTTDEKTKIALIDTTGTGDKVLANNGTYITISGSSSLPSGGVTGQVLVKQSDVDGDVVWKDIVQDKEIEFVDVLPTTGEVDKIYVLKTDKTLNWWDGTQWQSSSGNVDLSNYYTKTDVDGLLINKVDAIAGKQLSTEDFTTDLKNKLESTESVSLAEKTIWNNKSDFSGSYNDLTDKPTIPSSGSDITLDTTNFNKNLDSTVVNIQLLAEKVDKMTLSGGALPPGGNIGQILVKQSTTDSDAIWVDNTSNNIKYDNSISGMTATNVKDAIDELFQYANDMKQRVADVIGYPLEATQTSAMMQSYVQLMKDKFAQYLQEKFQTAVGTDTLDNLIEKIPLISQTVSSEIQTTKLNITAPYTKSFILNAPYKTSELCASLIEHQPGQEVDAYNVGFDNTDSSSFIINNNVVFDGTMHVKQNWDYIINLQGTTMDNMDIYYSDWIEIGEFQIVNSHKFDLINNKLILVAYKGAEIIKPNTFVDISGIEKVVGFTVTNNISGTSELKYAISFDGGTTFGAWNGSQWITFDANDKSLFALNGMNSNTINSLTDVEIEPFRNGNTRFMMYYYIDPKDGLQIASNDSLNVKVQLASTPILANKNDFNITYDETTQTLSYEILKNGTYTFNYVDVV